MSALDFTDRDRASKALVGLAESALKLSDTDSKADVRLWLETVVREYGDTPSVLKANELLKSI